MLKFVKEPNIPDEKVTHVLLGERYADKLAPAIKRLGVTVVTLGAGRGLDERVAYHADMTAHHLGENRWIMLKSVRKEAEKLGNIEIIDPNIELSPQYPNDVALNVLRLGGYAYGKRSAVCSALLEHLYHRGVEFIDVRQGYAKCSVCVVSRRAAITADAGLASALEAHGVDVLRISPGHIRLDGYDSGFIGGASGLLAPDVLAFTGRLDGHPDAGRIHSFLERHGVRPLELTEKPLYDVGSVLPLAVGSSPR